MSGFIHLVEYSTIIRRDVVCVKEESLLHFSQALSVMTLGRPGTQYAHLLKLVTGDDISTRPVRKSGREGKPAKSTRRIADAAPKRSNFRRSRAIV